MKQWCALYIFLYSFQYVLDKPYHIDYYFLTIPLWGPHIRGYKVNNMAAGAPH